MPDSVSPLIDSCVHSAADTLVLWLQRVERRHLEDDTVAVLNALQSQLTGILEAQP